MSRVLRHDVRGVVIALHASRVRIRPESWVPLLSRRQSSQFSISRDPRSGIATSRTSSNGACRRLYSQVASDNANPENQDRSSDIGEAPKPPLAIVFTDIVKSTTLWEKDCDSMNEAMTIHDNLVRDQAAKYSGYEVKQNGDGFMFAFQSAIAALNFCLNIQVQLQAQEWPQKLLELGPAEPVVRVEKGAGEGDQDQTEVVLWKGLRLRMSAHYGEPVCKWNEVISRMDYLGPAVNRAARFVSVCEGGQIVVSQEFLQELQQARKDVVGTNGPLFDGSPDSELNGHDVDLGELQHEDLTKDIGDTKFEVRMLGERHFKGVPDKQKMFFILPKSLHGRLDYLPAHHFVQASKGNLVENG